MIISWLKAHFDNILSGIIVALIFAIGAWIYNAKTDIAMLQSKVEELEQLFKSASYVTLVADELVDRHADRLRGPKGDKGEKGEVGPEGPPGTSEQADRNNDSPKDTQRSDTNILYDYVGDVTFGLFTPCEAKGTVVECTIAAKSKWDQRIRIIGRNSRGISPSGKVFDVDEIEFGGNNVGFGQPVELIGETQMEGRIRFEEVRYAITEFYVIELKVYVKDASTKEARFPDVTVAR